MGFKAYLNPLLPVILIGDTAGARTSSAKRVTVADPGDFSGTKTGDNPTDGGKYSPKRHFIVDAAGIRWPSSTLRQACTTRGWRSALIDAIHVISSPLERGLGNIGCRRSRVRLVVQQSTTALQLPDSSAGEDFGSLLECLNIGFVLHAS